MTTTTEKLIKPDGTGDYTNFAGWVAARKGNLVGDDRIEIATCYGGGDLGILSLLASDWTTDATRYPIVRVAAGQRHAGKYDASKARIGNMVNTNYALINCAYALVTGLQIVPVVGAGGASTAYACRIGGSASVVSHAIVEECLLHGGDFVAQHYTRSQGVFRNCMIWNGKRGGMYAWGDLSNCYMLNCTVPCTQGVTNSYTVVVSHAGCTFTEENNYFSPYNSGVYWQNAGTLNKGDHSATSNAEALTAALRNIAYNSTTFMDTGSGTEDLHLRPGSPLIGVGEDLSGSGVLTDIDGLLRSLPYDIGAHQRGAPASAFFVLGV